MQGIYQIRNTVNGSMYIGASCKIEDRFGHHRRELRTGKHYSKALQADWNKYGENVFEFSILRELKNSDLRRIQYAYKINVLEEYYIKKLKPAYNTITPVGNIDRWFIEIEMLPKKEKRIELEYWKTLE